MASSSTPTSLSLDTLSQALADYLQSVDLRPRLKLNWVEQSGRLLLVGQHGDPEVSNPNQLLQSLEAAFRDLMPTVGLADSPWVGIGRIPVRIYLKLKSASQPYAMHTFSWSLEDAARVVFPDDSIAQRGAAEHTGASPKADPGLWEEDVAPASGPFSDPGLALPETEIQPPAGHIGLFWQRCRQLAELTVQGMRPYWGYGAAVLIILGSGSLAYVITRPCVVGSCDRLDKAKELYTLAQTPLAYQPRGDDLTLARANIQSAIQLLIPIPSWSSHYAAAQAELIRYQGSLTALNTIQQAQSLASQAATLSQDPPHPVERWVNVQLLWQQGIDRLASISPDSPAFDYAQKKLREYRLNYNAIGRRIVAEEKAEANLNTAIQTGQLAQQRTETANSLAGWQLAIKEWQAAINRLALIPQGTMAYAEAQDQLQAFQQQLQRSRNRATLEESSSRNYDQAVRAARAATAYEAKNQWSLAVSSWQQAVANVQQIPADTFLSKEAAQLLDTYQPSLTNAQNRLRTAVALQGLTTSLADLCALGSAPCVVREDPSQVKVVLSSQYAEPLRQAITPPAADGTFTFTNQMSPKVQKLIEQIMTFSHQVNRQVAIYDNRGGFIARYRPDLGGFVKN